VSTGFGAVSDEQATVNVSTGSGATYLNKLIEQGKKDDGKKCQLEAQALSQQNKRSRVEYL